MDYDLTFLFNYLKREKIFINEADFYYHFHFHKSFPSLFAITDTLSLFGIENLVTRLHIDKVNDLPKYFLALMHNENDSVDSLFLIKKETEGFSKETNLTEQRISNEEFFKSFQGVILLVEKNENKKTRCLLFLLALLSLIYFWLIYLNTSSYLVLIFSLVSMLGVFFSLQTIIQELGLKNKVTELLCSSNNNCQDVINSKKNDIFNQINFPNLALTFFSSQSINIFIFSFSGKIKEFYNIYFFIGLVILPVIVMLIWYQKIVLKSVCNICLILSVLIVTEFILLTHYSYRTIISIENIGLIFFTLISCYLLISNSKSIYREYLFLRLENQKINHYKKKYQIFKSYLLESKKVEALPIKSKLIIGNEYSNLRITIVLSLFCEPCKVFFCNIIDFISLYEDKISFEIRFSQNDNLKGNSDVMQKLINTYLDFGSEYFKKELYNWYNSNGINDENILKYLEEKREVKLILEEHFNWSINNNINFTPTLIINDYIFPNQYDITELSLFITDLMNDAHI